MMSLRTKILLCVGCSILGVFAINAMGDKSAGAFEAVQRTVARLGTIGSEADESLEARNYTRIVSYPENLLFGAGEGGYARFDDPRNLELHSSLGAVLFSYGVNGMALFLAILYAAVRKNERMIGVMVFIVLLYGLTHQSARFTDFWVFLGVAYGARYVRSEASLEREAHNKNGLSISK